MSTSNVPSIVFAESGLVLPAESDILKGVLADFQAAFGGNFNPGLNTPQGQWASSIAAMIGDKNSAIASIVNQVNPAFATGRMQDAIGRIYFLDRQPALPTTLQIACMGLVGLTIPAGALIQDTSGNTYACTQAGTITASGSITLPFANQVTGPVPVPAANAVSISQAIPGWDSVSVVSGTVGANVETPYDFEFRRQQSVSKNGAGALASIYANVFALPGVLDVYCTENSTSAPITVGGQTLVPNSIYVAVVGGDPQTIANTIWQRKGSGANYNGNTTRTVTDQSGYGVPYPTYQVSFQTAVALPILFSVQITNSPGLPSNVVSLIQQAIMNAFVGGDGGPRARIGSSILASRYNAPVAAVDPNVQVLSIQLGTTAANQNILTVPIGNYPTITADNIAVTLV